MAGHEWQDLIWRGGDGNHWPPESRLVAAYLLSGPETNRIGCMRFDFEQVVLQTGLTGSQVEAALALFQRQGFIWLDRQCGWVWIPEVLRVHGFKSEDEVRRALPELAAVPRDATFRQELVQVFRSSADRPGAQKPGETSWLTGLLGEERANLLAQRLSTINARAHRQLPALPMLEAGRLRPLARRMIETLDYLKRWRAYVADILAIRELRVLGGLALIFGILFVVFPGIDLGVADLFFDPPRDFFIGASWLGRFFDTYIHYGMEWFLPVIGIAFLYCALSRHAIWRLTAKKLLVVVLSIAIGAGLMTNVVFKDSWGRARPSQVVEFGGPKQFSPPFMRSDQCQKNCSFVSGDAALAASFMSFALIADRHRRRWWWALGSFTAIVGFMRMARGSHFLSDVAFAVIFTLMVVFVVARLILQDKWRDWPRWRRSNGALQEL